MKQTKILPVLVLTTSITLLPIFAAGASEDARGHGDAVEMSGKCSAHMEKMHEHMKKMQDKMQQIHSESDADKRKKLMNEHHEEMMKGMGMMSGKHGKHGKHGKKDMMAKKEMMKKCPGMMEHKMDMMQSMMEQMMMRDYEKQKHAHSKN